MGGRDGTLRFAQKKKSGLACSPRQGRHMEAIKGRWFTKRESVGRVAPQRGTSALSHCSDDRSRRGLRKDEEREGGIY